MTRYVARCIKCQKSKLGKHSRYMKLVAMPTEECYFKEIEVEVITELPQLVDFNAILVVRD